MDIYKMLQELRSEHAAISQAIYILEGITRVAASVGILALLS